MFSLFEPFGLNKHRNFLPLFYLSFKGDFEALCEAAIEIFESYECKESAIFAIDRKGDMYVLVASDEVEDAVDVLTPLNEKTMDFFAQVDAEYRFCCYGLMVERATGLWEVIE